MKGEKYILLISVNIVNILRVGQLGNWGVRLPRRATNFLRCHSIETASRSQGSRKRFWALWKDFFGTSARIGHIMRRNCLLKHVIEGKLEGRIEMTERRGTRRKQLLDDLKEKRKYWKLKEEALDRTLWRTRFGRGY
jgi:hypothetical protein